MISKKHPRFYKPNIGLDPLDQGWASILVELSYQLKFQQRYVEILVIKSLVCKILLCLRGDRPNVQKFLYFFSY
jgi:hypothetical protein